MKKLHLFLQVGVINIYFIITGLSKLIKKNMFIATLIMRPAALHHRLWPFSCHYTLELDVKTSCVCVMCAETMEILFLKSVFNSCFTSSHLFKIKECLCSGKVKMLNRHINSEFN